MNFNQFMRLQNEAKQRNIDGFELQIFQEQVSAQLQQYEDVQRERSRSPTGSKFDTKSQTASSYHGLKKAKKVSKHKRQTNSLPRYIQNNINTIQFGVGTLPSDNMNMVMYNEFGQDFVRKMKEKSTIERELNRIASLQHRNMKHNVYMTKA